MEVVDKLGEALLLAAGMAWQVAWSLVLGFTLSGAVQALVSKERMRAVLGRDGIREIALAAGFGAASSSCSYAAAAMSKTLFKQGAGLVPSVVFLFASTNLVIELGIVLWLLLGWQFTLAEWLGGLVLIAVLAAIVKFTAPPALVAEARRHLETGGGGHDHGSMEAPPGTLAERLRDPATYVAIAQNAAMDVSMLWKDLALGFLIAGVLAAFVPDAAWRTLFLTGEPSPLQLVGNAVIGPVVAILAFVCSIGNVPLAAVLWAGGISFGGVIAFLYADVLVLPLLDVYRRYYGTRTMLYLGVVFFVAIVVASLIVEGAFVALHLVPTVRPQSVASLTTFGLDVTFWLNLAFGALAIVLWRIDATHQMDHHAHHHDDHDPVETAGSGNV